MAVNVAEFIRSTLDAKGVDYKYYEEPSCRFFMYYTFENEKIGLSMYPVNNNRVFIRVAFPFKAGNGAYAVAAMHIAAYNKNRAYAMLHLGTEGAISLEYTYTIIEPSDCNPKILDGHATATAKEALKIYKELEKICQDPPVLPRKERFFYGKMLASGLASIIKNDPEAQAVLERVSCENDAKSTPVFPFADA